MRGAPASSVAKIPGWPSVGTFETWSNPASRSICMVRSQPSVIPRFSAAMEGCWIQCCKRWTDSSWRFSIWARMPSISSAGRAGDAAACAHFGSASAAAPAAALCRNNRRPVTASFSAASELQLRAGVQAIAALVVQAFEVRSVSHDCLQLSRVFLQSIDEAFFELTVSLIRLF